MKKFVLTLAQEQGAMRVPNHIGLIVDGNRRWARKHGMKSWEGHRYGAETLERIIEKCANLKISEVSVYLLSTENLDRPKKELDVILQLFYEYLQKLDLFNRYEIRARVLGGREKLPPELVKVIDKLMVTTARNQKMVLNLLISYGSHSELMEAIKRIAENAIKTRRVEITPEDVENNLLVSTPIDLIIRTGGWSRLSNFMLWQASYAEIYVTETLWPDFSEEELAKSIQWFNTVRRNFGR